MKSLKNPLRDLPSMDRLLRHPEVASFLKRFKRDYLAEKCREVLSDLRLSIREGRDLSDPDLQEEAIIQRLAASLSLDFKTELTEVVNATGTILHTNLGRALLPEAAIEALSRAARRPVNLEYDLSTGKRGKREENIESLLVDLTGAEAACVVNNNAAAILLALDTLANGKEVLVSRGELIEIGGSFRIPDIMAKSGALRREVGTTNRTHPRDYEEALNPQTALLLKVHTSNYKIVGFASEVALPQLVAIARTHNLPVMEDLGSGALMDLSQYGLPKEPIVAEQIAAGAAVVSFSGDKILGGPQAGILVGKKELVGAMNKNPLKRALRCGKLTLAALEATLKLYRQSPDLQAAIPTLKALTRGLTEIQEMGQKLLPSLQSVLGKEFILELEDSTSQIGSGALPTEEIPTKVIAIQHPTLGADKIAEQFRVAMPPILGRVRDDRFLLDLRAIFTPEDLIPNFAHSKSKIQN